MRAARHVRRGVVPLLLFMSSAASAHHATAAEYDTSKTVVLKGAITRVDWANPHIHVYMKVQAERGAVQEWDAEFPSPGAAIVAGLSKQTLLPGAVLSLEGYPAKPDFQPNPSRSSSPDDRPSRPQHLVCATEITLARGQHFAFVVGI